MCFEELFVKEIKLSSEFVISSKPQIDHLQNVFLSVTDKKEQDAYYSRTMQWKNIFNLVDDGILGSTTTKSDFKFMSKVWIL